MTTVGLPLTRLHVPTWTELIILNLLKYIYNENYISKATLALLVALSATGCSDFLDETEK